ncbi:MAG: hypothetical protein HZB72_08995 [Burkholderiales bacterium]|nr:hypothetical protein [Burkholderiales bacterium]
MSDKIIDVQLTAEPFSAQGSPFDIGAHLFDALASPALMQIEAALPRARHRELWGGFIANALSLAVSALSKDEALLIFDTLARHLRDQPADEFGPESIMSERHG